MNSYRTENYIKDKVIVITGASSGFGKETAKKAAELGGKVVLAARREELLREITQEIRESGGEASYIKTDVRVKDQVNAMAKFAVDTYGRIDVLVNNAGGALMPAQCRLPITANTQLPWKHGSKALLPRSMVHCTASRRSMTR